jgi:hypothetical protein
VRCPTGEARLTTAGDLDVKYIIHTVGPIYSSAEESAPILESAYRYAGATAALRPYTFVHSTCRCELKSLTSKAWDRAVLGPSTQIKLK